MQAVEIKRAILTAVIVVGMCGLAAGGSALEFDGVDDYVLVQENPSLEPNEITVTAWVFLASEQTENSRIVRKAGNVQSGYLLAADAGNDRIMQFRVDNTTTGNIRATDTQTHLAYVGKWHHFAGVYDNQYIALYVDGVERSRVNHTKGNMIHTDDLYIGTGFYNPSSFFNGLIDEVGIYSRALSALEIEDIYHCGVAADANLVGYWDFEEGAGQVAYDNSAYDNDGYLGSDANNADSADPAWIESEVPVVTYHVDVVNGDNGNDGLTKETAFASIQMGIDSAEDCDRVLVWPGVYNESLFFINKGITVQSAADAAEIVASGIYGASLYTSEGPDSILKNFVIRDSDTGVYVSSGAPWLEHLTVVNCDLGVEAEAGAEPNIVNSILWNNAYDLFQCEAQYSWVEEEMEANLVAYWRFEEGSGTTAYDWVGDNDGTIYGATWTSGKVGGALEFDGSNDYVEADIGTTSGNITYAFWFKSDNVSVTKRIVTRDWESAGSFTTAHLNGEIEAIMRLANGTPGTKLYSGALSSGSWYHTVCIFDGTSVALYVNGSLKDIQSQASILLDSRHVWIGATRYDFDGAIDEVGIWDRALSAAEVRQLYENGLAGHEYIDPVFADAEGGDYHLKSERGRYWPEHDVWVLDEVSSPCIDAGDARVEPSGEPAANGGRINMGAYGNTAYASMSEWGLEADFDSDGAVGLDDVGAFTDEWLEAVTYSEEGGSALEFDGVDDYVDLPDGFADFADGFTVTLWAYPTHTGWHERFIDFGNGQGSDNIILTRVQSTDDLIVTIWSGGSQGAWVYAYDVLELNMWQHFAATVDGTGNTVIYKNGAAVGSGTTAVPRDITRVNNYIGRSNWPVDAYYKGRMDDVRIYKRVLDEAEIGAAMHAPLEDGEPNLVGYWDFEEGAGQVAADGSGNGNDGQLGSSAGADSSDPVWVESEVPGVTYHVDGAGGDNDNDGLTKETAFASIQFGIDTAEGCDRVLVWPGVYNESLFFINKGITVRSAADAAKLMATGLYAASFYNFGGADATLSNFVITDSDTGVYVGSGQPELTNLTVVGNWMGVEAEAAAEPNINSCIFWGNDYDLFQCTASYSLIEEEIDPNLVAYWKLDGDAVDSAGSNDGTVYGATPTTGQIYGALSFDGVDDYVDCGSTFADVVESATKTIMAWAKSDRATYPTDGGRILTLYRESGSSGFVIAVKDNPPSWQGLYRKAGNVRQWLDSGVYLAADEWTHVALVQDGANVNLYINGVSGNSATDAAAPTTQRHVNADIGAYDGEIAMMGFFDGTIDEVVIWDRALDANEIERIYEDGLAGRGLALEPLFADANGGDYHLLSERGRYWPAQDVWVLDDVTSPSVDGGDPSVAPVEEPMPNGARVNMGAYGATAYASMSEWPIAGDMDEDGIVNMVDYAILADSWLSALSWATNEPPVVDITSPEDGAAVAYNTVDPVMVEAEASDADGSVVKVEFFANGGKIGQDNDGSDGWDAAWHPESEGAFSLSARATDDDGATANSPVVNVEVGYVW